MTRGSNGGESLSVRYMLIFILLNLNILKHIKQEWHLEFRCMLIFFAALFFLFLLGIRELRCRVQVTAALGNRRVSCGDREKKGKKKKNTETFIYFPHQRRQREVKVSDRLLKVDLSEDVQVFFLFCFFPLP